jgi:hypothetical protein
MLDPGTLLVAYNNAPAVSVGGGNPKKRFDGARLQDDIASR